MHPRKHIWTIISIVLLLCVVTGVRGRFWNEAKNGEGPYGLRPLGTPWAFQLDDQHSGSIWIETKQPKLRFSSHEGRLCFRNTLPETLPHDAGIVLLTNSAHGPFSVFVEDGLIYSYGEDKSWFARQYLSSSSHSIPLPDGAPGKQILIEFTSKPYESSGFTEFPHFGSVNQWSIQALKQELPIAIIRMLMILSGVYCLIVVAVHDEENRRTFIHIGTLSLLTGLNMLDSEVLSIRNPNPWLIWYLTNGSMFLLPVAFLLYIENLLGMRRPNRVHKLAILHVWIAAVLLASPQLISSVLVCIFWGMMPVTLGLVSPSLWRFLRERQRPDQAYIRWAFSILVATACLDLSFVILTLLGLSRITTSSFYLGMMSFLMLIGYKQTIQSVENRRELAKKTHLLEAQSEELKTHRDKLERLVDERTHSLRVTSEALLIQKDKAESANRAKSIFLASVSHELRTPLNGILGFTQILRRNQTIQPEVTKQIEVIHQCGDHLLKLINNILDTSRIESGKLTCQSAASDSGSCGEILHAPPTDFILTNMGPCATPCVADRSPADAFETDNSSTLHTNVHSLPDHIQATIRAYAEEGDVAMLAEYLSSVASGYPNDSGLNLLLRLARSCQIARIQTLMRK